MGVPGKVDSGWERNHQLWPPGGVQGLWWVIHGGVGPRGLGRGSRGHMQGEAATALSPQIQQPPGAKTRSPLGPGPLLAMDQVPSVCPALASERTWGRGHLQEPLARLGLGWQQDRPVGRADKKMGLALVSHRPPSHLRSDPRSREGRTG